MKPQGDNSREHLMRCLARWVLDRPSKARAEHFVHRYTRRHGAEARRELVEYMKQEKAKRDGENSRKDGGPLLQRNG